MHHQETVRINAPIDDVFAYVTDPGNLPDWDSDIRKARYRFGGPTQTGTAIEIERTVPPSRRYGTFRGHVTEYEPTTSFAVAVDEGPLPFDVRYGFVDAGASTELRVAIHSEPRGLRRLLEPLASRAVHRQITGHYARLKQILEHRFGRTVPRPADGGATGAP